jgi:hypothetical protein
MRGSSQAGLLEEPLSPTGDIMLVGIPRNTRENSSSEDKQTVCLITVNVNRKLSLAERCKAETNHQVA